MSVLIIEGVLLVALIAIAVVIIMDRRLLAVAVTYCAFSFIAMLLYTVVGAADVAFTEAVIGTISTVYFVIVIKSIRSKKKKESKDEEK